MSPGNARPTVRGWPGLMVELLLYVSLVSVVGTLVAYGLYRAWGLEHEWAFHKLVLRSCKLVALPLLGVWLHLEHRGGRAGWGLEGSFKRWLSELGVGMLMGVSTLLLVAVLLGSAGVRQVSAAAWDGGAERLAMLLLHGFLTGVAVASIEELWFRGGLLAALSRTGRPGAGAAIATSVLYAATHYIKPDGWVADGAVEWWTGFEVLAGSFGRFVGIGSDLGSFIALFLAGALLCLVRLRTGRIAAAVGIHAGWVLVIQVFRRSTEATVANDVSPSWQHALAGSYDGTIGWMAAIVFVLAMAVLYRWRPMG